MDSECVDELLGEAFPKLRSINIAKDAWLVEDRSTNYWVVFGT